MKKFLSILLAGIMLACMIPTVAFAEDAPSGIFVGETQYSSIDAAAAAAYNTTSKTITIRGSVEVGSRQTIAYEDVKLVGENNAKLVATTAFANASATNKKALFTVTASGVEITNVEFDGSPYGNTLTSSTDFVVVRINSGENIVLDGVSVTGSKRTLVTIGTSSTIAKVTASGTNGLICNADYIKPPVSNLISNTFAAVNIVNGELNLNKGQINGFLSTDYLYNRYEGTLNNNTNNNFTLRYRGYLGNRNLTSTVEYFVGSYIYAKETAATWMGEFVDCIEENNNSSTINCMVSYASTNCTADVKADFVTLLQDAATSATGSTLTAIQGWIATLSPSQGGED